MKWIALALFLIGAPILAAWLRTKPKQAPIIWGLLTFLPFVLGPWHLIVAPHSTPLWSGYVKGWEVSLLDAIAVGVIFGTRERWPKLILLIPFLAYLVAAILAVFQARFPNLALSYPIQLARVGLVFLAVARAVMQERGERAVLTGLILGLTLQAGYAIVARAGGALQTGGSLGHQNMLGFVSHMALMPAFAMLLSGRRQGVALLGVLAGVVVVILTASRATIVLAGFGLALTLLVSVALRFTGRKAMVAVFGVLLLAGSFPFARASLERRLSAQGSTFLAEDNQRVAFEQAARDMMSSKPFGVGPNHYVFVANTEGYSARAGVNFAMGNRSANVHNSYLLVGAETGYPGLLAMVILLGCAIWYAFSNAIRYRRDPSADILVGVGCGLVAMSLHGLLEWMFVVYPTEYLFAGSLGLIAGIRGRLVATSAGKHQTRPVNARRVELVPAS